MKKKLTAVLLSILVIVQMLPLFALAEEAETPTESGIPLELPEESAEQDEPNLAEANTSEGEQEPLTFLFYDEESKALCKGKVPDNYTLVTSDTTTWNTGWYVVDGEVSMADGVTVAGDVKLLLKAGSKLSAVDIGVNGNCRLSVFGNEEGSGRLEARLRGNALDIHGGTISASGPWNNLAGIDVGTLKIYNGSVTANGGYGAPGICCGGTAIIYGGAVTANGGYGRSGIDGAIEISEDTTVIMLDDGTTITKGDDDQRLRNGSVSFVAVASDMPAVPYLDIDTRTMEYSVQKCENYQILTNNMTSLTDGWYVVYGSIDLDTVTTSGDVRIILTDHSHMTATGRQIGNNGIWNADSLSIYAQSNGDIMGSLTALGAEKGAGIAGHTLNIFGGNVRVNGGAYRAGISASPLNVYGGNITTNGGYGGAGIGGGLGESGKTVTIFGGNVAAYGGENAAGIGGGKMDGLTRRGNGGNVEIHGGNVTAKGWDWSTSSIGYGTYGNPGTLTVDERMIITIPESGNTIGVGDVPNNCYVSIVDPEYKPISYIYREEYLEYENGGLVTKFRTEKPYALRNPFVDEGTAWTEEWYEVEGTVTIASRMTVTGDVRLILKDGCELKTPKGITVSEGSTLTIYGQTDGTGKLTAKITGSSRTDPINKFSAIGGGPDDDCGTVNIHGGIIDVIGGSRGGAGIGGGYGRSGGIVNIYGGKVNAVGGLNGAGIGGGDYGNGGTVNICGGTVTATSDTSGTAAGIGGGNDGAGGSVTISGGKVDATGVNGGSGIGSGRSSYPSYDSSDEVIISGGLVTATGQLNAGISGSYVKICGGAVTAAASEPTAHSAIEADTIDIDNMVVKDADNNRITAGWSGVWKSVLTDSFYTVTPIVEYLNRFGMTEECDTYTFVTEDTAELTEGWYVVGNDVKINGNVTLSGDANLILTDGKTLTVTGKITGRGDFSVYAQSDGSDMGSMNVGLLETEEYEGDINIYGGNVTAANLSCGSSFTVYNGNVTVTGGGGEYGIYSRNVITIKSGIVTASGGNYGIYTNSTITVGNAAVIASGAEYGIYAKNKFTYQNGEVIASGNESGKALYAGSYALSADTVVYDSANRRIIDPDWQSTYYWILSAYRPMPYLRYDEENGAFEETECVDYRLIDESISGLTDGWYVLDEDVTINGDVTLSGNVELILCDGKTLTVNGNISGNCDFSIYAQSSDFNMGALEAISIGNVNSFTVCGGCLSVTDGIDSDGTVTFIGGDTTVQGGVAGDVSLVAMTVYDRTNELIEDPDWQGAYYRIVPESTVTYLYRDEESTELTLGFCHAYETLDESNMPTALENGKWYLVTDEPQTDGGLTFTGDVHIILVDTSTLTVSGGIAGDRLYIHSQSIGENAGKLICNGKNGVYGIQGEGNVSTGHKAHSGSDGEDGGNAIAVTSFTVDGATVSAIGGSGGGGGNGQKAPRDGDGGDGGSGGKGGDAISCTLNFAVNSGIVTATAGSGGDGGHAGSAYEDGGNGGSGGSGGNGISAAVLTVRGGSVTTGGGSGGHHGNGTGGHISDGADGKDGSDGVSVVLGEDGEIIGTVLVKANETDAFIPLPSGESVGSYCYAQITEAVVYDAPVMLNKTSIRTSGVPGLRFAAYVTSEQREASSSYGFIVARENDTLKDDPTKLVFNDAHSASGTNDYAVTYTSGVAYDKANGIDKIYAEDGEAFGLDDVEATFFTGVMQNIPKPFYAENLIARPYIVIDGVTLYGETYSKSLYDNACAIRDGGYQGLDEDGIAYINSIISAVDKEAEIDVGGLTE